MYKNIGNLLFIMILGSCGPFPDLRSRLLADLTPPALYEIRIMDNTHLSLQFDEPIHTTPEEIRLNPLLKIINFVVESNTLHLTTEIQNPGQEYELEINLQDKQGNGTNLFLNFYGFNPRLPELLLNEFITQGSKNHPDLLELKVLAPGNMAGVTVFEGMPEDFSARFIFPPLEVIRDDFILIHFKPQNIPAEVNETISPDESGGLDAADTAYDFWLEEGNGLSGNNGVLALCSSPRGELLDSVFYSNRNRSSDQKYGGFGSTRNRKLALALVNAGGWQSETADLYPEDGVNPEDSTSTRSLCRDREGTDTDCKTDWHIVPTRMSSFGLENCEEVFIR